LELEKRVLPGATPWAGAWITGKGVGGVSGARRPARFHSAGKWARTRTTRDDFKVAAAVAAGDPRVLGVLVRKRGARSSIPTRCRLKRADLRAAIKRANREPGDRSEPIAEVQAAVGRIGKARTMVIEFERRRVWPRYSHTTYGRRVCGCARSGRWRCWRWLMLRGAQTSAEHADRQPSGCTRFRRHLLGRTRVPGRAGPARAPDQGGAAGQAAWPAGPGEREAPLDALPVGHTPVPEDQRFCAAAGLPTNWAPADLSLFRSFAALKAHVGRLE